MDNKTSNSIFSNDAINLNVDEGLRNYMNGIYNKMSMALGVAGGAAFLASTNPVIMGAMNSGLIWVAFIALLGLGFFSHTIIMNKSMGAANTVFWGTAALWGLVISPMTQKYAGTDLVVAFLSTAIAFAGVSIIGYTTKKDLSPMGRALGMAVFGILAILILNIFFDFGGTFMNIIMPVVVIGIFDGLTAYETQNLKKYLSPN